MKNAIAYTLAAMTFSSIGQPSPAQAFEVPYESVRNIDIPNNIALRPLYNSDNSFLFISGDMIFAKGSFNKKFLLKTPYGKQISIARIYEMIPNNRPLLVIRDDNSKVVGFVQLENYRRAQLFKRVTGIVYDRNGTNILKVQYPLASKYFEIFNVSEGQPKLLASTKAGSEGDIQITFHTNYRDAGIEPALLLTLFQIHASKSLLVSLADYLAIDEIPADGLAAYAVDADEEKWVKNVPLEDGLMLNEKDADRWLSLKEQLAADGFPCFVQEDRKEAIAAAMAQRFDNSDEESLISTLQDALETLSNEERSVLLEMISNRLPDNVNNAGCDERN